MHSLLVFLSLLLRWLSRPSFPCGPRIGVLHQSLFGRAEQWHGPVKSVENARLWATLSVTPTIRPNAGGCRISNVSKPSLLTELNVSACARAVSAPGEFRKQHEEVSERSKTSHKPVSDLQRLALDLQRLALPSHPRDLHHPTHSVQTAHQLI